MRSLHYSYNNGNIADSKFWHKKERDPIDRLTIPRQLHLAMTDFQSLKGELRSLIDQMDEAYDRVAQAIGFECQGCQDNCCYSRFYHHTWLETLFLLDGFWQLPADRQDGMRRRSEEYIHQMRIAPDNRPLCPINLDGLCGLYACRPMICRLHGVRHALQRPGGQIFNGPGCEVFESLDAEGTDPRLDRTPVYRGLAMLERQFAGAHQLNVRPRLTVAEMIRLGGRLKR